MASTRMLRALRPALLLVLVFLTGCVSTGRKLPPYEKPLKRTPVQTVRTTAYTHTEDDHRKYGQRAADGTMLDRGAVNSAAADWSRWPVGTKFRVVETGEIYQVDDYGWMLAGTNTIDLYKPTRAAMNRWGVRRVNIEILEWGSPWRSFSILKPRAKYEHVKLMLKQLVKRYHL